MLITVLLGVLLIVGSYADADIVCNNSSEPRITVFPANDGVEGRYNVEWCTATSKEVTDWELTLRYDEDRPPERCQGDTITYWGPVHSYFKKNIKMDLNCTNVCFSTSLDLIFNGTCYLLKTLLHYDKISTSPEDLLFYVKNDFPKTHFTKSETRVSMRSYNDERLSATWFLSYIPASEYTMKLCSVDNSTSQEYCTEITRNCSVAGARRTEVRCGARAAFGRYDVSMRHRAPWDAAAIFRNVAYTNHVFDHKPEVPGVQETGGGGGAGAAWWGAAAALALAAAGALALLLVWRRKPMPAAPPGANSTATPAERRGGRREPILLLYARDCDHVMRVAAILRRLLQRATDEPVMDLHSGATLRAAAGAAGEWVRRAVCGPPARVVLLQSAAARLAAARAAPRPHLPLEQPLLGQQLVYRQPSAADALVSLALRLLAETAHTRPDHAYRHCYKTRITGLDIDMAPTITPLRWYSLPEDVLLLLRDLDPGLFPEHKPIDEDLKQEIQQFQEAIQEMLAYVKANPNYLNEEILFI